MCLPFELNAECRNLISARENEVDEAKGKAMLANIFVTFAIFAAIVMVLCGLFSWSGRKWNKV
jgi:hypothetical protein